MSEGVKNTICCSACTLPHTHLLPMPCTALVITGRQAGRQAGLLHNSLSGRQGRQSGRHSLPLSLLSINSKSIACQTAGGGVGTEGVRTASLNACIPLTVSFPLTFRIEN